MTANLATDILEAFGTVLFDLAAIALTLGLYFALLVRRLPVAPGALVLGSLYVIAGLTLLRTGLDISLIPAGLEIASHLAAALHSDDSQAGLLHLMLFAGLAGFAVALIEPALTTMARRAEAASGGAIPELPFRFAVACGVGSGLALGVLRIYAGLPFDIFFAALVATIMLLSWGAPKLIRPIAYDSGAVATSVVVVPLVTAIGIGIASTLPDRSALADGFGMVTGALLLPVCTVLLYARIQAWRSARPQQGGTEDGI